MLVFGGKVDTSSAGLESVFQWTSASMAFPGLYAPVPVEAHGRTRQRRHLEGDAHVVLASVFSATKRRRAQHAGIRAPALALEGRLSSLHFEEQRRDVRACRQQ